MGSHRIQRNFRNLGPSRFHAFNQKVKTALIDKARFPDSFWGAILATLLTPYVETSDKHDAVYHESMLGSKLLISEREVLQQQLVEYLDQIASFLEMAAVRTPEILLASGFDLSRDRRGRPKASAANHSAAPAKDDEGEPA
ncbi:hypothetical protein [Geomonas edaphica]|uniref:hypothetical protein n=1 Tax=Geomonas edaphica TaxID=2570226 RepID=UPI0010A7C8E9|nr:hypothetical protein [Geomonas edaphica]